MIKTHHWDTKSVGKWTSGIQDYKVRGAQERRHSSGNSRGDRASNESIGEISRQGMDHVCSQVRSQKGLCLSASRDGWEASVDGMQGTEHSGL